MRSSIRLEQVFLRSLFCVVLAFGLNAGATEHYLQAWQPQESSRFTDSGLTMEEAIARVRQQYGGRVISAMPLKKGVERSFRVRIDVGGRVRDIEIDAKGRFKRR